MACDSDKLTFNTLHVMQETLSVCVTCLLKKFKCIYNFFDFVSFFGNVFDMNTFVLIISRNWNLSQPMINKKKKIGYVMKRVN